MNRSQRSRAEDSDRRQMISHSRAEEDFRPRGGRAPSVTGKEAAVEQVMEPSQGPN